MISNSQRVSDVFSVHGKVFDTVTRNGIEGLLVTVYGLNEGFESDAKTNLNVLLKNATRVGTDISDENGGFSIEYNQDDIAAVYVNKRRLDLLLVVSAPDDENGSAEKAIFYSNPPRLNAGRLEKFNIGISGETQKKFGWGANGVSAEEVVESYVLNRTKEIAMAKGIADFNQAAIQQATEEKVVFRKELLEAIATNTQAASLPGIVVGGDKTIKEEVIEVAKAGVNRANAQINANDGVPVNLYLTPDDRDRLKPFFDKAENGFATIHESEIGDILFRTNSSENPGTLLVHHSPIAKFCAEHTFEEKCAMIHTGLEGTEEPEHQNEPQGGNISGPNVEVLTNEDIPKYAAALLNRSSLLGGELSQVLRGQRANSRDVDEAVNKFSLRKGPADVPAFHFISSLQIAFDHVWKILVDEEMINTAFAVDRKYRQKTNVPISTALPTAWTGQHPWVVYETIPMEVPADVAAQFDITLQEWIDLSASHQTKLLTISLQLATGSDLSAILANSVASLRRGSYHHERMLQDLREQGERLIDAVRHDDYYTMHKTLRELHNRINSQYEFTVFAADENQYSVNFGLITTYKQKLDPLNYQVGRLIKTIPLAPEEERTYSVKTTRNLKHAVKEARKNNTTLKYEQKATTRVEAEIMEKAQNKTNFGMSAEGDFDIYIWEGKGTTTFGVEALQESSGIRKDMRESLLNSAQEITEEITKELVIEESLHSEYSESGKIRNTSNELAMTYLFYELQQRYHVEEELYGVLPTVLVAQDVPAPHQITESWVIAHDWIINRFLLDDSFRKSLEYLANKSVGDDFALRELRKNLRQQRNLVETLRIDHSIVNSEVQNRYRALENKIEKRIVEESSENSDGFLADVGDFFGGGGQDPEAAKARELAAKDAHQYAVEKAEKAAAAMRQEVNNLHALTAEYNKTLREHLDNETSVKRLLAHIRMNIIYYMQAIWSMEPPHQRIMRLHKVQVPVVTLATIPDPNNPKVQIPDRHYKVSVAASKDIFEAFREPGTTKHKAYMFGNMAPITEFKPLIEVANFNDPPIYAGNYMVLGMSEHNALTEFMAAPYIDSAFGAMDPDELSNVNLDEFAKYICCLHDKLPAAEFEALKEQLKEWLELLLADPLRNGDEIVIPTDSLYMEIMSSAHSTLDNFRIAHRELDVYKVQEELLKAGMESLRLAARLVNDERDDPDVEKKIIVEGGQVPVIDS